jgi:5-deoxy-D-glucuronate isomerase
MNEYFSETCTVGYKFTDVGIPHSYGLRYLNVMAKGGTVRWNRHITPDLCLATSWLYELI